MRYAVGHWCMYFEDAAQWITGSSDDGPDAAIQRAIESGEMGRLLTLSRAVQFKRIGQGRWQAVIADRAVANVIDAGQGRRDVRLYWTPRQVADCRKARDMAAARRIIIDHCAEPDVADPYAYLAALAPRDQLEVTLLAYFASALINGDTSGLSDADVAHVQAIEARYGSPSDCREDNEFGLCEHTGWRGATEVYTFPHGRASVRAQESENESRRHYQRLLREGKVGGEPPVPAR